MFKRKLRETILELAHEVRELRLQMKSEAEWFRSHSPFATKEDLKEIEIHIMSAISEFAAKQTAFNDKMDIAVTGITADIQGLNDLVTKLQNTPGQITPEDQELLNQIETRGKTIADKLEALDALTPPVTPVE